MSRNYLPIREFREFGYLQEINRQFLHPLGLALEVAIDADSGEERIIGVWDERRDPAGICFLDPDEDKADRVRDEERRRENPRKIELGYWVQPVSRAAGEKA